MCRHAEISVGSGQTIPAIWHGAYPDNIPETEYKTEYITLPAVLYYIILSVVKYCARQITGVE